MQKEEQTVAVGGEMDIAPEAEQGPRQAESTVLKAGPHEALEAEQRVAELLAALMMEPHSMEAELLDGELHGALDEGPHSQEAELLEVELGP